MITNPFMKYVLGREFVFELFIAFCLFAPWRNRRKFWFLTLPVFFAISLGGVDILPIDGTYKFPMIFAALFLTALLSFKLDPFQALFYSVDSYALQFAASCLSFVEIPFIDKYFVTFAFKYFTHVYFSMNLLYFIIFFAIIYRRKFKAVKLFHTRITITSMLGITFFVFLSTLYKQDMRRFWLKTTTQNIVMLLFVAVGIFVLIYDDVNTKHKQLVDDQKILELMLKKDELQYEQTKMLIERINIREHDLRHQQEVRDLSDEEKEELNEINSTNIVRFTTGNASIDVVLSEHAYICHKKGIQLLCNINGSLLDFMKPAHIASLFTNALSNSINYLEKLTDIEKKIIRVSLQGDRDNILLVFQNYFEGKLEMENNLPKTTNKDTALHGFGLKSIQNIVSMYDGYFTFSVENNTFTLMINLSEPPVSTRDLLKGLETEA